jgi:hypothetical protein
MNTTIISSDMSGLRGDAGSDGAGKSGRSDGFRARLSDRLVRFFEALPDRHVDIDPATLKQFFPF